MKVKNDVKEFNALWRVTPRNQRCDFLRRNNPANDEVARAFDRAARD
jgi:hypothetical protein